jgi:HEAT repeat protein
VHHVLDDVDRLANDLNDPDAEVRRRAIDALGEIEPAAAKAARGQSISLSENRKFRRLCSTLVTAALGDLDEEVRRRAADALVKWGADAVRALDDAAALYQRDIVRRRAVDLLGRVGPPVPFTCSRRV